MHMVNFLLEKEELSNNRVEDKRKKKQERTLTTKWKLELEINQFKMHFAMARHP